MEETDNNAFDGDMFHGLDALILVYDITNESSFDNLNGWISLFSEYCIESEDVPILVLGNKKDLESQRKIAYKQGKKFTHKLTNPHKIFREVSCKEKEQEIERKNDDENADDDNDNIQFGEESDIKDIFTELARNCINRESSVLQLMSCDSLCEIDGPSSRNGLNRSDFNVKTCTENICGRSPKDGNYDNSQYDLNADPFCVVL